MTLMSDSKEGSVAAQKLGQHFPAKNNDTKPEKKDDKLILRINAMM